MKEEFPDWFGSQIRQCHIDNDLGVSATSELFALPCGPTPTLISVNSCVVNGVRFVVPSSDERRTTQNSCICSPGGKDREMYCVQLQEILEFSYLSFKVVLYRIKWFDTSNKGRKVKHIVLRNNMTQILTKGEAFKDDQYIFATQVKQCFYLKDMARRQPHWKMSADVARGHGGDGGGDDRPPTHHIPTGCGGCFVNRGKDTRKPNLGGRKAGRLHTRQETQNLGLKKIADDKAPNQARATQNRQNRAKSTVVCRQGSRSLARLRDQMMESSATREYPSLIHTFFVTHTVGGVFMRDEDRAIYEEILRLQDRRVCPTLKKTSMPWLKRASSILPGWATYVLSPSSPQCTHNSADVEKLKKKNKYLTKQVNLMMKLFRSDDKFSHMLNQYESSPEFGNASGSGGCGDDEMVDDEDGDEDEEDEEDGESPAKSLGNVAWKSIPSELSPSSYLRKHVAWDLYPQRQVAREGLNLSLGIVVNVIVKVLKYNFLNHVGVGSWFSKLLLGSTTFNIDERVTWIDIEGGQIKIAVPVSVSVEFN
nr:hypothetical protein [Tanacetum cinerariifolium]